MTDPEWIIQYGAEAARCIRATGLSQAQAALNVRTGRHDNAKGDYASVEQQLRAWVASAALEDPRCPPGYSTGMHLWHDGAIAGELGEFAEAQRLFDEGGKLLAVIAQDVAN